MCDLADRIQRLHQAGLHRVPARVPGIIQDAPACTECGLAWPCTTYQLTIEATALRTGEQ